MEGKKKEKTEPPSSNAPSSRERGKQKGKGAAKGSKIPRIARAEEVQITNKLDDQS